MAINEETSLEEIIENKINRLSKAIDAFTDDGSNFERFEITVLDHNLRESFTIETVDEFAIQVINHAGSQDEFLGSIRFIAGQYLENPTYENIIELEAYTKEELLDIVRFFLTDELS